MIWLYVKFWTGNDFPSEYRRLCTIVFWLPVLQMRNLMNSYSQFFVYYFVSSLKEFGDFYHIGSCNFVILDLDVEFLIYWSQYMEVPCNLKLNVLQFWKNFFILSFL